MGGWPWRDRSTLSARTRKWRGRAHDDQEHDDEAMYLYGRNSRDDDVCWHMAGRAHVPAARPVHAGRRGGSLLSQPPDRHIGGGHPDRLFFRALFPLPRRDRYLHEEDRRADCALDLGLRDGRGLRLRYPVLRRVDLHGGRLSARPAGRRRQRAERYRLPAVRHARRTCLRAESADRLCHSGGSPRATHPAALARLYEPVDRRAAPARTGDRPVQDRTFRLEWRPGLLVARRRVRHLVQPDDCRHARRDQRDALGGE